MHFGLFKVFFIFVAVIVGVIFILTILMVVSPKIRAKFMSKQIKATKYMIDEVEDDLTDIATKRANINKEGVEITAKAIKDGLTDKVYCKYCGKKIDKDSKFCKICGKEQ